MNTSSKIQFSKAEKVEEHFGEMTHHSVAKSGSKWAVYDEDIGCMDHESNCPLSEIH